MKSQIYTLIIFFLYFWMFNPTFFFCEETLTSYNESKYMPGNLKVKN